MAGFTSEMLRGALATAMPVAYGNALNNTISGTFLLKSDGYF
jgi:hypothetical protein